MAASLPHHLSEQVAFTMYGPDFNGRHDVRVDETILWRANRMSLVSNRPTAEHAAALVSTGQTHSLQSIDLLP